MKIRTSELEGAALDWAVAKVEGLGIEWHQINVFGILLWVVGKDDNDGGIETWSPRRIWSQGGPLIDEYRIAFRVRAMEIEAITDTLKYGAGVGRTHLIAACRAIVAAKLGEYVDVPGELLK